MSRHIALLAPVLALAACGTPHLEAMARYGEYSLDGDLAISSMGINSSNSMDTLGLDDSEGSAGLLVDFKWGGPHLTISTQSTSYSGEGRLESELSFGGDTIDAGDDVDSDFDLGLTTGVLTWDLAPGPLELGLGLGVTIIALDASFEEIGMNNEVSTDESLPAPMLAARAGFELGPIEVNGLLTGFAFSSGDDEITFYDLDIFGRYKFFGGSDHLGGSFVFGWRQVDFDVEYEDGNSDVELDFSYSGPYIGLQLRF